MPIDIEKGFKTTKPNEKNIKTSQFEWLQEYKPNTIQQNKDIFHKEPIKTMKDVYKELEAQGEWWRMEHEKVNEKTGKVKQVPVPPLTIANIISKVIPIVMLGDISSKDRSLLYYYDFDTGLYVNSDIEFKKFASTVECSSTIRTWANVIEILKMNATLVKPLEDRYLIPVQNGVYNLQTKQLEPFDPSYIITSKIATAYKNNAVKPTFWDVDKWLSSLACGDEEIVTLLWQIMNEAINPNHTRQKIGILYGQSGNNGKGTFQTLLINLIGRKNVSTLKPAEFNEKFKIAQLIGKVCNIGDDISDAYIDDISNLMSIAKQQRRKGNLPLVFIVKLFVYLVAMGYLEHVIKMVGQEGY